MFSDETRFNLIHSDGRMLVWRQPRERFNEENMAPQEPFGGGSVNVWGGVMNNGKTELYRTFDTINSVTYRENNINRMDWPPKSPDMNIIEHVWSRLKLLVCSREHAPETLDQLGEAILQELIIHW